MKTILNFLTVFDRSPAIYFSGETVSGYVELALQKTLTGLDPAKSQLQLSGFSKVHFTETYGKTTYHYISIENYVGVAINFLDSTESSVSLEPGVYRFPFSVAIPPNAPSSFMGGYGKIRYRAEVTLARSWKRNRSVTNDFFVSRLLNLTNVMPLLCLLGNEASSLSVSQQSKPTRCCCCCVNGSVTANVSFNQILFVPGQAVTISIEAQNNTNRDFSRFNVELIQQITYVAFGAFGRRLRRVVNVLGSVKTTESLRRGESVSIDNIRLCVPLNAQPHLIGCSNISIAYFIKVYTSAVVGNELNIMKEIMIGTMAPQQTVTIQPNSGLPGLPSNTTAYLNQRPAEPVMPPPYSAATTSGGGCVNEAAQWDPEDDVARVYLAGAKQPVSPGHRSADTSNIEPK